MSYTGVEGAGRTLTLDNLRVKRNGIETVVTSIGPGEYVRGRLVPEDTSRATLTYDLVHVADGTWAVEIPLPMAGVYTIVWSVLIGGTYEEWVGGLLTQHSANP